MCILELWSKKCQNLIIPVKKPKVFKQFALENAKIWQVLSRKRQLRELLMEKLV